MRRVAGALLVAALSAGLAGRVPSAASGTASCRAGGASGHVDFDGDGYADLAVGAPLRTVDGQGGAGAVLVLYGAPSGAGGGDREVWTEGTPGLGSAATAEDHFGWALAAGDLDGDGYSDLAIGTPGRTVGKTGDAGAVFVIYGSAAGLTAARSQTWTLASDGVRGSPSSNDALGASLAVADLGYGDEADLVTGLPTRKVGPLFQAGAVSILYGTLAGVASDHSALISLASPGIEGKSIGQGQFGVELVAADLGFGGKDDLAVGSYATVRGKTYAGAVNVLFGGPLGVTGRQDRRIDESSLRRAVRPYDLFGSGLAAGQMNSTPSAELVVGAPGRRVGGRHYAGAVYVLKGTRSGPAARATVWSRASQGIGGRPQRFGIFGEAVAVGDFGHSAQADLAVGSESSVGGRDAAGDVTVLYSRSGRLRATGSQLWDKAAGKWGGSAAEDYFGRTLTAGPFNGAKDDLVVGAPGDDFDDVSDAGSIVVLSGTRRELSAHCGRRFVFGDSTGMESPGGDDAFGSSFSESP